jgi:hypothetical protein
MIVSESDPMALVISCDPSKIVSIFTSRGRLAWMSGRRF